MSAVGRLSLLFLALSFLLTLTRILASLTGLHLPLSLMIPITSTIFISSLLSSMDSLGWRGSALLLAVSATIGLAMEILGVLYGIPFGNYRYSEESPIPMILGLVPVNIPLFWFVIAYSSASITNTILRPRGEALWRGLASLVDGLCATSWDLIMDPVQVNVMRAWRWTPEGRFFGVPLSNFLGWILVVWLITFTFRTIHHGEWGETDIPLLIYLQLWFATTAAAAVRRHPEYLPAGVPMIIFTILYLIRRR